MKVKRFYEIFICIWLLMTFAEPISHVSTHTHTHTHTAGERRGERDRRNFETRANHRL